MRLVVPYWGDLNKADARLVRLADFLGAQCELLHLERGITVSPEFLETHVGDKNSCFVINPEVIRGYLSSGFFPPELASYMTSRFFFVLIHNLSPDPFTSSIVSAFSEGLLHSVHPVESARLRYEITSEHKLVCGVFSGLNFGPVNEANDRVFSGTASAKTIQTHISIGGQPFFASIQGERAEVFFLASAEMADLDASLGPESLTESFSQLVPAAMFIRYAFREESLAP